MRKIVTGLLICLIVLVLAAITSLYFIFDARSAQGPQVRQEITIEQGASLSQIAQQLYAANIISNPKSFKAAAYLLRKSLAIYPGSYTLNTHLSNTEALEALAHAKAPEIVVTIPEGLRSDEIIGLLSRKLDLDSLRMSELLTDSALLAVVGNGFTHLEGTLFPDTYRFLKQTSEQLVLSKMVSHFKRQMTPEILARAEQLGFDLPRLITFASLVEKETGRRDERRIVASVYHNRLQANMLLGCDPTIIYMLVRRGEWKGNIQRKHFSIRDPYNSYLYRGLPPGPIANPGMESIEASLNPETTDYLYFVGKNDGTGAHDFSKTLREHNNKVNRYQRRRLSK